MMKDLLRGLGTPALALAAVLTVAPMSVQPHSGVAYAETGISEETSFQIADGKHGARRARGVGQGQLKQLRTEIRLQRLRVDQLYAEAARADRRARRAGKRARQAIDPYASRQFRQARKRALRARDNAEFAAVQAERRLARLVRKSDRLASQRKRVDRFAPRPKLAPAILRKIEKYAYYRRPGENTPAFVVRIARAEELSRARGQTVAYWLHDPNHRRSARNER